MHALENTILAILLVFCAATAGTAQAQIAHRATGTSAGISFVGSGAVYIADNPGCNNVITPAPPAGNVGDLLIALVNTRTETGTYSAVTGWNLAYSANQGVGGGNSLHARIYYKIATGMNPANDPFSLTQSSDCRSTGAQISRFRNVDTVNPLINATIPGANAVIQNAPNINTGTETTVAENSMLIVAAFVNDNAFICETAGWNSAYPGDDNVLNVNRDLAFTLFYQLAQTAGAKTIPTWPVDTSGAACPSPGTNERTNGVIFSLRPAVRIIVPTGTIANDVMIANVTWTTNTTITPPAGWTLVIETNNSTATTSRLATYRRLADAADAAGAGTLSYEWRFTVAQTARAAVGAISSYSGVDTSSPVDVFSPSNPTASSTMHQALSITPTMPNTMLIRAYEFASSATWSESGTERADLMSQAVAGASGISMAIYEEPWPTAVATVTRTATASANADRGGANHIALRPQPPVLSWTMDQSSWNGTAGEVTDASGNGLNGRALNGATTASATPVIAGNPGSCQYANLDGTDDYLEVANNALLSITDELTVMAWIRPTALPTGANLKTIVSKDDNYEFHLDSAGRIYWWWGGAPLDLRSTGTVAINTWTHVAIVYSRSGGFQRIFINGVQDASTNNQTGTLPTNALPFQVGADQGAASRQFPGLIDEVNVYRSALGASGIQAIMSRTRTCTASINHFSISHSGTGVACVDQTITITAHDASHAAVNANGLTLALSTENNRGTWTGIVSGGGTLTDLVAGDGAASYQFAAGSNSVQLAFRYANLAATSETFGFNISGGGFSETIGTADASDDPSFTMAQAGFQFRNATDGNTVIPTQISGKPSDTGFNTKTIRLQAIRTDTATGACTGLFASQTRFVDLGAECNNPGTCAAAQVSINGSNIATSNDNGGAGAAAYTGVFLAFDAGSEAVTVINYPDAAQISLHARQDLDPLIAGFEMVGSSNAFVVRPFAIYTQVTGNPGANTPSGTVFTTAGTNFSATVKAVVWQAADDANNDGIPDSGANLSDNAVTPNYAYATTLAAAAPYEPSTGTLGVLDNGSLAAGAFGSGVASPSNLQYTEVGSFSLTSTVTDYLGDPVADVAGLAVVVGRFTPHHFNVTKNTPRFDPACAAGEFSYIGQSFGYQGGQEPVATVTAVNALGATTRNYTGTWRRLSNTTLTPATQSGRYAAFTGTLDTSNLPAVAGDPAIVDLAGASLGSFTLTFSSTGGLKFTRTTLVAPFDADIGLSINVIDADSIVYTANPLTFGAATAGNGMLFAGAGTPKQMRFGRLRLTNAFGSSLLDLLLPVSTQYYDGNVFTTNTLDSCTTLNASDIIFSFVAATPNLVACETHLNPGGAIAFASGTAAVRLTKPGNANDGAVDLTVNLGAAASGNTCTSAVSSLATAASKTWLQGNWGSGSFNENPRARASFGVFKNADQFLYFREVY